MMDCETWQKFLDSLTKIVSTDGTLTKFSKLQTDLQRVKFLISHTFIDDSLSDWIKGNMPFHQQKNASKSLKNKLDANKAYALHKDDLAFQLYNIALLYSPQSDVSVIYGNRSAVLYSKNSWKECLIDIECALEESFPHEKQWKLYKRKAMVLSELNRNLDCVNALKKCLKLLPSDLFSERNEIDKLLKSYQDRINIDLDLPVVYNKAPNWTPYKGYDFSLTCASPCLQVNIDKIQGRYITANADIPSGSIVISEKPYAAVLLSPWYHSHCQNCFSRTSVIYPCYTCTEVVFCSPSCRKQAMKYHNFECGKLSLMEKIGIAHLSLRIILVSHPNDLLRVMQNKVSDKLKYIPGFIEDHSYKTNYESVFHLLPQSEFLQIEDLFQYSVAGLMLFKLLLKCNYIESEMLSTQKYGIASLLMRHIQQLVSNAHAITCLNETAVTANMTEQNQVRIATAIYPTTSLLNHSCEPDIVNCFHNDRLIVKVVKDIKRGEQIYNCYGPHYKRMPFQERQKILKQQYFFVCQCDHCVNESKQAITQGFICNTCKNILKSDFIVVCENCGGNVEEVINRSKQCYELFLNGMQLLSISSSSQSIKNALKLFLQCFEVQKQIYTPHHQLLSRSYDVIGKCYTMLKKSKSALIFIKESVKIVCQRYGSESIEYTNELLKLTDIYMQVINKMVQNKDINIDMIKEALSNVEISLKLVSVNKEPCCDDLEELQLKKKFLLSFV